MISLAKYLQSKDNFNGVSMIRLVYNNQSYDYTVWKFSGQNIVFYDDSMRVCHILWTNDTIEVIDDTHVIINYIEDKHKIGLELFYGGAIL